MKRILFLFALITSVLVFTGCDEDLCVDAPACINGTCNPETGTCECETGFTGTNCDLQICDQSLCQGTCNPTTGACECDPGFTGANCDELICTANVNCINGECDPVTGDCNCSPGWTGVDCNTEICTPNVNCINGDCNPNTGNCDCDPGWTGAACDIEECDDNDCGFPNGFCDPNNPGLCACYVPWLGSSCECNGDNGTYDYNTSTCNCDPGWTGSDCNTPVAVNTFNGTWNTTGVCGDYSQYYTATIQPDNYGVSDVLVFNFGGFGANLALNANVSGNTLLIPATQFTVGSCNITIEGTGTLNMAGTEITMDYTAEDDCYGYLIACQETWILQ